MRESQGHYGNDIGPALIQFYTWLRDTGELDRLIEDIVAKVREDREEHSPCPAPSAPAMTRCEQPEVKP